MTDFRVVLHADMDNFFASVEQRDNPGLRRRSVLVGGAPDRMGVVAAASYEAQKSGARSGMSMQQAQELCPDAVILPPNIPYYVDISRRIMEIFQKAAPLVQAVSLEEAYMDISSKVDDFAQAIELAHEIKEQVKQQINLTCSMGIAPNPFLAKIASDIDKPGGFFPIRPEEVEMFLHPLPVRKLPGISSVIARKMEEHSITKVSDLLPWEMSDLCEMLSKKAGRRFYELARGIDLTSVDPNHVVKSLSREQTFIPELTDFTRQEEELTALCHRVWIRVIQQQVAPRTVGIKVCLTDYSTIKRYVTPLESFDSAEAIAHFAIGLFHGAFPHETPVRLLGVRVENFTGREEPHKMLWEGMDLD
jgi:DNA polymerase IV